jgi:hypothetical protein
VALSSAFSFCAFLLTLTSHCFRLQGRISCGAYHIRSYIGEDSNDDEEDVDNTDDDNARGKEEDDDMLGE